MYSNATNIAAWFTLHENARAANESNDETK